MASRPALDGLPLEILSSIINQLDTADSHNLRLVSRPLAHQLYPEMPTAKTINAASESDLRLLIAMTELGQPGCALESLTLVEKLGAHDVAARTPWTLKTESAQEVEDESKTNTVPKIALDEEKGTTIAKDEEIYAMTPAELEKVEAQEISLSIEGSVRLLTQAFANLSKHSTSRALHKLGLQTADCRRRLKDGWKWQYQPFHPAKATGDLQKRAFLALHASPLPITALEITGLNEPGFNPTIRKMERRRLVFGCDGLASIIDTVDLSPSLRSLKAFSIEFSPSSRQIEESPEIEMDPDKTTTRRDYLPLSSISKLLSSCPNLESLRLKGYDAFAAGEVSLLQHIVDSCPLPLLKTCILDGFGTRHGELLAFLQHFSNLESVSMMALYETNEQYVEIFNHIATKMPQLKYLHLDNMTERKLHTAGADEEWKPAKRHIVGFCWFDGDGVQHYPHNRMSGANAVTREGEAVHVGVVKKEFRGGRGLGSLGLLRWRQAWSVRYGSYPGWK